MLVGGALQSPAAASPLLPFASFVSLREQARDAALNAKAPTESSVGAL